MKAFKAFIKPFEVPQRSVKMKISVNFFLRPGSRREELRCLYDSIETAIVLYVFNKETEAGFQFY